MGRAAQGAGWSAAATRPERKAADRDGVRGGMYGFHAKFGQGRSKMIEGAGADARAQVDFSGHGVRWLALSVAKLTVVQ